MSETPQSKTHLQFEPVESPEEAKSLLGEAVQTLASTLVWTRNRESVIKSALHKWTPLSRLIYIKSPADFDEPQFLQSLKTANTKECYFSISLARANVFFRTQFIGTDIGSIGFSTPTQIFKVQRRKDMRLKFQATQHVFVDFTDPVDPNLILHKRLIDLSAGGLCFLISPEEKEYYPPGQIIEEMKFKLGEEWVVTRAEVKYARLWNDFHNKKDLLVGVSFPGLPPGKASSVARFVFEENRKIYTRFMGKR